MLIVEASAMKRNVDVALHAASDVTRNTLRTPEKKTAGAVETNTE